MSSILVQYDGKEVEIRKFLRWARLFHLGVPENGEHQMQDARIRPASLTDLPQITGFLKDNGLTTVGVDKCWENFVIALNESGSWVGIAGLEIYNRSALLRSVVVDKSYRGIGHGRELVRAILKSAREKGAKTVYLFTENAEAYFRDLGFEVVSREEIDKALKASPEFTECGACVAMRRIMR